MKGLILLKLQWAANSVGTLLVILKMKGFFEVALFQTALRFYVQYGIAVCLLLVYTVFCNQFHS